MNFYGGKKTNGLSSVLTLFVKRRQKKHKNRRAIRLTYNAKLSRNISSLTNFKQVILTVCLNPRQQAAGARYGCKYNSLRKLCDNTLKTNKKQKANRSLLVKNVGPSCIYVNMRDSKTIRWHVLSKKKKIGEREQVQSALFPGHTLLVRSFSEMHFIIFTVYNSKMHLLW